MNRSAVRLRALVAAAALGAALLVPAGAEAAKLKISGSSIRVTDDGVAAIKLTNPNRSTAKGTLTLKSNGARVGSERFSIRPRRAKQVKVEVVSTGALVSLAAGDDLVVAAYANAKGKGTSRKSLTLTYPGATGGDPAGGAAPGGTGVPGGGGGSTDLPATGGIPDGTIYKGTTDQGESFEFMKVAGDAVEPLSLHVHGTCFDSRDNSTTIKTGHVTLPGRFPLGSDGRFAGEGTKSGFSSAGSSDMRYTIAGGITGDSAQGTFSLHWEILGFSTYPVVTTWQIFCGREITWTAQRQ